MERLFLAIDFPLDIKEELYSFYRKYQGKDIKGIKWVKKQNLHITLKFFGDTTEENKAVLIKSASETCSNFLPFNVCFEKTGVFPERQYPRVLWLGISEKGDSISKVQAIMENNLFSLGFEKEKKKFTPHLTIARINNKDSNIINFVREFFSARIKSSDFVFKGLVLFKSILKKEGAVYEPVCFFPFYRGKDT